MLWSEFVANPFLSVHSIMCLSFLQISNNCRQSELLTNYSQGQARASIFDVFPMSSQGGMVLYNVFSWKFRVMRNVVEV